MPFSVLYEGAALVESAAVVSIFDEKDALHKLARAFFHEDRETVWYAVDTTSHESFTRIRYDISHSSALAAYDFLRMQSIQTLKFEPEDELCALGILKKYDDQKLSFQDALCAAVMRRVKLYKVFTFDSDFSIMGFEVIPGTIVSRKRR